MVLDFANEAEDIQKAFEPYYEKTLLKESTDPNILYLTFRRYFLKHNIFHIPFPSNLEYPIIYQSYLPHPS
jgi:type I site-specific restriction-modification system R (restriction) subunit